MNPLTARPQILKQVNLSQIRKLLKRKGTATRAEIAREIQISSTTVRSLLADMLQSGEIESVGYDESSGGRKAERYSLQPNRYYGAAICITNHEVHALTVDLCGKIVETARLPLEGENYQQAILPFLDQLVAEKALKAIGLGLPGIVEGGEYWRKHPENGILYRENIGDVFAERYGVPVVLENDINATTIGFGRCCAKQFPQENAEHMNMAYLHFEERCVSAGFIAGGRVIRGHNHFAGELGLIPVGADGLLDEVMSRPMDDKTYIDRVIQMIGWICGILNPQYVALAGPALRKDCIAQIGSGLSAYLPDGMVAEILYAPDVWHDYHDGMAHLTAEKMFEGVHFITD